jgi:hypothetical protein
MWQREFSVQAPVTAQAVWRLFSDVDRWGEWNAGIEQIALRGPFAAGTEFVMKPPGQDAFVSRLVAVDELRGFTDETVLGDVRVVVDHRIVPADGGGVRITYAATVTGPDAVAIGEAVTEDFPQVLQALVAQAARARAEA